MDFKVGDMVFVDKDQRKGMKGTIKKVNYLQSKPNKVYYYSVKDETDKSAFEWTYNVFVDFNKIWLDIEGNRNKKLNNILK